MFRLIPAFHWANSVSLLGLFFSINGIYNSLLGDLNHAVIFFVLAGVCDLFDGKFAQRFKRNEEQKQMGEWMDSFVDVVSFAAFPVILLFRMVDFVPVTILVAFLYVVLAIHRLGYFHLTKEEQMGATGSYDSFIGLPITYAVLIISLFYTVFVLFQATHMLIFQLLLQLMYILIAFAFVWDRPIPKPKGKMYLVFVLIAISVIVILGSR